MRKKDLFRLQEGLQQVGNLKGARFVYAVAKNSRKVNAECEDILMGIKPTGKSEEFRGKQHGINMQYCKKNDAGNPIPDANGQFIILPEFKKVKDEEMDKLKSEYEEVYAALEKQIENYSKSMNDEIEFVPHTIKEEDLPDEITASQLEGIFEIVE
ncbi:MAG: hypothetical protein JKY55_00560 [Aliivibrio sp.]|uniref:hypothetical protein n=1 Tax=Aliivibrio sp. TaxID=1872443 RepID=UPI001A4D9199|nr:hypothetical protein [Aliivibrio sp.]